MRLLLDTHVAIWSLTAIHRLPSDIRQILSNRSNDVFVSAASIWEIALKFRLGRKDSPPFDGEEAIRHFTNVGYDFLNLTVAHAAALGNLDTTHPDPFNRLLIAQAITEPLILVTRDSKIAAYSPTFITW
ncbi:type II toxin-antitoxin system VapC family toxin [Rhizobium sp. LjRoot98]|uniref:type II toxin-antitoxin system VapC family toxin n=1 Tax=unclassified Rhizobium TaxID=2613769 RepID=UPI00055D1F0F|nr:MULTISPECIES: type II toxin-antitoxin system VapC family toxin [unclassified Rhizobium]KQV29858.1 twitching motility protein PilT [Rhizobium sp. Root1204]KQY05011.1 twitching motility protein PilT [Rhizobium sp. Root1334]KRC01651.1 twitching motility protein PilT [Rhizobium sp. Root73]